MVDDSDWLSWVQAAELVGCPVPTIEHHARTGRIERRQVRGRGRGSLKRESVEAFAIWWRDRTSRLETRKAEIEQRRIRPPEPEGWIDTKSAVEILGCKNADHVIYLGRQGRFKARKVSTRWWVREAEVREYARDRDQWVSHVEAARIVGCSGETIRRAVNAGRIEKRDVHRTQASLSLASVLRFAVAFGRVPRGTT